MRRRSIVKAVCGLTPILSRRGTGEEENEQKAIALIRDLRGKGYKLQAICWELEKEGYKTRRGNLKWQPKTVSRIIERLAA